jgi:FtsZ-binding cell division protein ZapB
MDSGGWIMVMMLAGTAVLLLVGSYPRRLAPPLVMTNGWRSAAEALQQQVEELRQEITRLKRQVDDLRIDRDGLTDQNVKLRGLCEHWRSRFVSELRRNIDRAGT